MDDGMQSSTGNGGAIDKALAVLSALPDHESIAALSAETRLPKPTVHRILRALVDNGYAVDLGKGRYAGGPAILALAGRISASVMPAPGVERILRDLQEDTGFTVHLAVRSGDEAVYTAKIEGHKPYRMPSRIGMSIQLHSTGIGKAILSTMTDDEVLAFAERAGLPRRTPTTHTRARALLADLEQTRGRGYAVDDEENEVGIWCVGAAVSHHFGHTAGAVSVSTLTVEVTEGLAGQLGPRVVAAAAEISAVQGFVARS